uniref:PIN domain-containing protein n=1 Tax=Thermus tengchongensis TaxID=1214928 RepID=A0A7V4AP86_9DEIN
MRFWDTSALVPLLVQEETSGWAASLLKEDPEMAVFWVAEVEATSALNRRLREGHLDLEGYALAQERLRRLKTAWHEVLPGEALRRQALRLLRLHPLRTLDALHLAALTLLAGENPEGVPLVSLDARLAQAALLEGFPVLRPQGV